VTHECEESRLRTGVAFPQEDVAFEHEREAAFPVFISKAANGVHKMFHRYEHKTDPLAPRRVFFGRLLQHFLATLLVVTVSLLIGTLGYHYCGDCDWLDALVNAAMILTGMGPVTPMTTVAGKLFSVFYALFSGIAFLSMVAILIAPIAHRFLHHLHAEFDDEK